MNKKVLFITSAFLMSGIFCQDPVSPDTSNKSPIIKTEIWELNDETGLGKDTIEIRLHEDSTMSCIGTWIIKDYYSAAYVECVIKTGVVRKDGTSYTISCSGTASYPEQFNRDVDPSNFSLKIDATFENSEANGDWELQFFHEDWKDWNGNGKEGGSFTGSIIEGDGITG
jgi:hypothetical protein